MEWTVIRLELASSWEFPRGSVGRSLLIRLPLSGEGSIETSMLRSQPTRATVRRYWASEPDMTGHLIQTPQGFAIRYETNAAMGAEHPEESGTGREPVIAFGTEPISVGDEIVLTEADGRQVRLRVD